MRSKKNILNFKLSHITFIASFTCILAWLSGCSPTREHPKALDSQSTIIPHFDIEQERFTSFDGAKLGLTVWQAKNAAQKIERPKYVVVGVHGMNDYANAFEYAGPYWAARGVTTYAYDQRGFGRSHARGLWPEEELMRDDLRTAIEVTRQKHPHAILTVVGISMGSAVVMTAFADNPPTQVDRVILSGPGLRGWGALPLYQRISLWFSSSVNPGWVVVPPKSVVRKITPSDNYDMLVRRGRDKLNVFDNRIDQVYGVVSVMENGHKAAVHLPPNTLMLYGAHDDIIPEKFMRRTAPTLPKHVRTAYYQNGYHMLMRDLAYETILEDELAFMHDPNAPLPSDAPPIPWAP